MDRALLPRGGRGGRARPFSVPSWVSVVGRVFCSPLPNSLNPGGQSGGGWGAARAVLGAPCRTVWAPRAWSVVGARSSRWRRLADGSSFFFMHIESQIPRSETRTDRYAYPCGRSVEGVSGLLPLPWRPCPHFCHHAAPSSSPPQPPPQVDQMAPESPRPGVHGVVLGTGGRVKVLGSLPASRRWAPLSTAVILSPEIGLFCHQVSADTVSFGVCHRGLWVSGCTRGSGPLGRQLAPDSAFAAGAARLGLCAGSCVVLSG